jgi:hypothetical protein
MSVPTKTTPPAPDPAVDDNPGYAEAQPRDAGDARSPHPEHLRNPDDGGLDREPADGSEADTQ